MRRRIGRSRLGELHDDAERLLGMEERLPPLRIGVVTPHDAVTRLLGAGADVVQPRHLEGDVVNAGAPLGEKAVDEPIGAERLDELDGPAPLESIGAPVKTPDGWPASGMPPSSPARKGAVSAVRDTPMAM